MHVISFNFVTIAALLALLGVGAIVVFLRTKQLWYRAPYQLIVLEELFFVGVFIVFVLLKYSFPDAVGVEHYMNHGIVESLLRGNVLPPQDMFFADAPLNYYYFGHLIMAVIVAVSGVSHTTWFSLATATIPALCFVQVFSLGLVLLRRYDTSLITTKITHQGVVWRSVLLALAVTFSTNFTFLYVFGSSKAFSANPPLWEVWHWLPSLDQYYFLNSARFLPFSMNDMPAFTNILGDLHAHTLALPLSLCAVYVLIVGALIIPRRKEKVKNTKQLVGWGVLLGVCVAFGGMASLPDMYLYSGLVLFTLLILFKSQLRSYVMIAISFIISLLVVMLPFRAGYTSFGGKIGINCAPDWLVGYGGWGPFVFEPHLCAKTPWYSFGMVWGWIVLAVVILTVIVAIDKRVVQKTPFLLAVSFGMYALILILLPEFFYISDGYKEWFRANTVYKLGYVAYGLGMIAFIIGVWYLGSVMNRKNTRWLQIVQYGAVSLIILSCLYTPIGIYQYTRYSPKRFTLDSQVWLKTRYPGEYEMIQWLRKEAKSYQVVLEAYGDPYTHYGRISAYTGLNDIIQWNSHEKLWRNHTPQIQERTQDIDSLYTIYDKVKIQSLIDKYGVHYVVITPLEKSRYPKNNQWLWESVADKVYSDLKNDISVYKVFF